MRDIITIPLTSTDTLIIASDNSGGIGMKAGDRVQVSYETVAYYSFRVAAMECIAAGGVPLSVVLHNFCGDHTWNDLIRGIQKGLAELNLEDIPITGSTESNFPLQQSAIGLVVLGQRSFTKVSENVLFANLKFAVIGSPLVGNEVIDQADKVLPLSIFQEISKLEKLMVWPVGSKGILYEINQMFPNKEFTKEMIHTKLDVLKSSGPATCCIIAYEQAQEEKLKKIAAGYYHFITVK